MPRNHLPLLLTSFAVFLVATACATKEGDGGLVGLVRKAIPGIAEHGAVTIIIAIILVVAGICWRIVLAIMRRTAPVRLPVKWKTTIDRGTGTGAKEHETTTLHQFGPWVWGKATTKTTPPRTYRLSGRICGGNLCLRYREDGTFDVGAALLAIRPDRTMNGIEVGVDSEKNVVASFNYIWTPAD